MSDEIFDPEIHAVDKDGQPSLNKDGSFRKKRKDAGGGRSTSAAGARTRTSKASAGAPREKYRRNVADFLALPAAGLSMVDPVMGYAATEVVPLWADSLADLAAERPEFAAVLERLGGVGAVGGVLTAALLTGVQFGHLAGKVPPHVAKMMGCKSRGEIEAILRQRGEQMARAQGQAPPEHARAEAPEGVRVMAGV